MCRDTVGRTSHDTALARGTTPTTRRPARCDTAQHPVTRPGAKVTTRPSVRMPVRACARLCALVGPGWMPCAPDSVLTQFLDSVLFLSHGLDTAHEHYSSQRIFGKKIKIN